MRYSNPTLQCGFIFTAGAQGTPETKPGNGKPSPDSTAGAGPSYPPDPSNTHCGLQPLPALKDLPVLFPHCPHPVLPPVPLASPPCPPSPWPLQPPEPGLSGF